MSKKERRTIKGLKAFVVISFILLAAFIAFFVLYAIFGSKTTDLDFKDFASIMNYHFEGIKDLFTFNFHKSSNFVYDALSPILYALLALWLCLLILGIVLSANKKRAILVLGIILTFFIPVIYIFGVTGAPKYWLMINNRAPFNEDKTLGIYAGGIMFSAVAYALVASITYVACFFDTIFYPNNVKEDEPKEEKIDEAQPEFEEEPAPEEDEAVMFEQIEAEPEPVNNEQEYVDSPIFEEEPVPEFEEEPQEEKPQEQERFDKNELAELIRNIVRDEMTRNAPNPQNPGPGPLVVQYFGTMPLQQEVVQPKQEPKPEPVKEEKKEPVAEVAKEEEIQIHDKIVPEEEKAPEYKIVTPKNKKKEKTASAPVVEQPAEKNKIIRIPFQERMLNADDEMKRNYNELKNEILSYGVNSRVSNSGDAFRLHRKTYVKITIAGLSLKLYFALNPDDYKDSTIPVQDAGHKGIYADIPLVFKVKSGLSMRRAKELIQTVMDQGGLEQGAIADADWVEKLKEQPVDADEANED